PPGRYGAPPAHDESPQRRSRDPRARSLAAAAVGPVRRAAEESHRPTPGPLASRSDSRRSDARRAARLARRKSDGACSRASPDRWDSDQYGHHHALRGWNSCPRPLATNQSDPFERANPAARSESDPTRRLVANPPGGAKASRPKP